ncbi:MAG TPA: methyltransferase domain-containing protein [Gemmatimonadaceae bacterium]|jgi:SAM-dependent methyltransferase|nr:methyltransferase domain-containing protein [Gemmatimonadaceae bacterium]
MTSVTPRPATLLSELLICPRCAGGLSIEGAVLRCARCGHEVPVVDGIPCFAEPDRFYDEYADVHCPFAETPKGAKGALLRVLPFWSHREWRFWRQAIPIGGRLLDLGAGRGKEIFIERARETVGLDGSLAFLRGCTEHYDAAVLASLPRLPFHDASFDVVASSHVIGHIAHADKETLVAEIARVLRAGGTTAHIIETDSTHPTLRAAKARPELYQRWLVEQDGHIGLEPAAEVVARFERHGFELRIMRHVDAIVPSAMYYHKYLEHPGFETLPGLAATRSLARLNRAGAPGNLAYEVGMGLFHRTAEQWFGRSERANFVHVAFVKRA